MTPSKEQDFIMKADNFITRVSGFISKPINISFIRNWTKFELFPNFPLFYQSFFFCRHKKLKTILWRRILFYIPLRSIVILPFLESEAPKASLYVDSGQFLFLFSYEIWKNIYRSWNKRWVSTLKKEDKVVHTKLK